MALKTKKGLAHRSDFFPGLGWMMLRTLWLELGAKWPEAFWDDWIRDKNQRRDRACLRPEISRTEMSSKSAKNGVSM
jgi:alpha-1,3-mannosyl-glycoprotein beta-1,2-N-acetylglucosaminyltransferase